MQHGSLLLLFILPSVFAMFFPYLINSFSFLGGAVSSVIGITLPGKKFKNNKYL